MNTPLRLEKTVMSVTVESIYDGFVTCGTPVTCNQYIPYHAFHAIATFPVYALAPRGGATTVLCFLQQPMPVSHAVP
ncbi:hypothetical protein [Comamonas antarctica]|uniref:Uncharacterized protein n=1 Tax=Comamonas antarctica TaxID=2743470 RepID=A0A6N1X6M9_9BURK|nr:hypothetical protein [Comamonas antarctica]QKV53732.1 hypothetical protein HUK68_12980 [Comamonas antarctica]